MTPDFTEAEIATIRELLVQRYQKDVEIRLADSEVLLNPGDDDPALCPTVFWYQGETNFVVVKTGDSNFRTEFFYTPHEQFGTGVGEYSNLERCVAAVLQIQSDHERQRLGVDSASADATVN